MTVSSSLTLGSKTLKMIDKFLNWILDYESGRFILTGLILVVTYIINAIQFIRLLFNDDEVATKLFIIKLIGLIPPLNILTIWF